ncbi:regulatory protein TetR [Mycolicibacterium rhodesiae JS60]|nr:regulatory protein TetR [Mycolicibacterium rhodesiae JS60]
MNRQEQAQATRAALVAAARESWAQRGFFATSTSDIVAAAGVGTRGAFYAHFPDRESLFLAVFDDVHRWLSTVLDDTLVPSGDPLADLQLVLLAFLDVVVDAPDVQALLVDGPALFGAARWHHAEQTRGLAPIEARIEAALRAGVIEAQPVRPLATILLMLVNDTALHIATADDRAAARRDAGAALARLISGLRVR